ncbi:F-box only protein 28 [Pseudolycoriella hygida]|uniref:F-box only protein 28 n=1 Tax=Pseudolycoriella hygida TaxID=35572 RepID=A0A9Q0N2S2_9DIPT|nr:F-box only protein 28 [Pseudolycoriella hygida]
MNICCFIPGKIIDEILNILKVVSDTTSTCKQLRVHEVLQELRDISSMAIDHFDEKIAHILKKSFCDLNAQKFGSSIYQILQSPIDNIQSDFGSTSYVRDTAKGNTKPANCKCEEAGSIRRSYLRLNKKYKTAMRKITRLESVQAKQMRMQRSYALSITQMNSQIVDLRRRLEESESKSRDIITNYNQLALLGQAAGNRNRITRNIKPRAATIILKRRINEQSAAEEKRRRTAE